MIDSFCRLCISADAVKTESHIISKFMGKGLFEDVDPRHALQVRSGGKFGKAQDTPKESFFLCAECERRFEILETYFARFFSDIKNYQRYPEKFVVNRSDNQFFLECTGVPPTLFKLFIYSLVWRSSVSKLPEFRLFKLQDKEEESLRVFLNKYLKSSQSDMLNSVLHIQDIPCYHNCLIIPEQGSNTSRGFFCIYSLSSEIHLLSIVNVVIMFYASEVFIYKENLEKFSNKQNDRVLVCIATPDSWFDFHQMIADHLKL